jgi:hypothetical protein
MVEVHRIALRYFKSTRAPVVLSYRQVPISRSQARYAGRDVLVPDISLDAYTCNAVIDWIQIDLQLTRVTQQQWLADAFAGFGRRPYIEPIDAGAGKESSHFEIKVQEPDLNDLQRILDAIERRHGLLAEPVVIGLEVSVDFTPKTPSDEARARMVGVLFRHLAPDTGVFSTRAAMPRHVWGKGHRWLRIQKAGPRSDPYTFAVNGTTNSPGADTTTYFGAEESDEMMRVMDKVIDRQNTFTGTSDALSEADQRCRVEVTLKQSKLAALGIQRIADVSRFRFATLQGTYFQFKLATVWRLNSSEGPVSAYIEKQRVQKFLQTGISGLAKMDQARLEHDAAIRPLVRRSLAKTGKKLPGRPRTGSGPYGTAVAFEQLCRAAQMALSNLSRKLKAQVSGE